MIGMRELPRGRIVEERAGGPNALQKVVQKAIRERITCYLRGQLKGEEITSQIAFLEGKAVLAMRTNKEVFEPGFEALEGIRLDLSDPRTRITIHEDIDVLGILDVWPEAVLAHSPSLLSTSISDQQLTPADNSSGKEEKHDDKVGPSERLSLDWWRRMTDEDAARRNVELPAQKPSAMLRFPQHEMLDDDSMRSRDQIRWGSAYLQDGQITDLLPLAKIALQVANVHVISRTPLSDSDAAGIPPSEIYRLRRGSDDEGVLDPSPERMMYHLEAKLWHSKPTLVIIDGLEHVAGLHGSNRVIDSIEKLSDLIRVGGHILLLSLDIEAWERKERKRITRTLDLLSDAMVRRALDSGFATSKWTVDERTEESSNAQREEEPQIQSPVPVQDERVEKSSPEEIIQHTPTSSQLDEKSEPLVLQSEEKASRVDPNLVRSIIFADHGETVPDPPKVLEAKKHAESEIIAMTGELNSEINVEEIEMFQETSKPLTDQENEQSQVSEPTPKVILEEVPLEIGSSDQSIQDHENLTDIATLETKIETVHPKTPIAATVNHRPGRRPSGVKQGLDEHEITVSGSRAAAASAPEIPDLEIHTHAERPRLYEGNIENTEPMEIGVIDPILPPAREMDAIKARSSPHLGIGIIDLNQPDHAEWKAAIKSAKSVEPLNLPSEPIAETPKIGQDAILRSSHKKEQYRGPPVWRDGLTD